MIKWTGIRRLTVDTTVGARPMDTIPRPWTVSIPAQIRVLQHEWIQKKREVWIQIKTDHHHELEVTTVVLSGAG